MAASCLLHCPVDIPNDRGPGMNTTAIIQLPELAERIACELRAGVEHAARAGALLTEAKGQVPHGQWLPWLDDNFGLSERSAQNYMRLSRKLAELPESKAQRVADLPLRDALELLAEPKETPSKYRLPSLDANHEYTTVASDGRLIVIAPSADHKGFYFVDCFDPITATAHGWSRPILGEYVAACLGVLRIPDNLLWSIHPSVKPRHSALWNKERMDDFVRYARCNEIGVTP